MEISPFPNFLFLSFYGFIIILFILPFGDREVGIIIKNVDISIGEVMVNLNEGFLVKRKSSLESHSGSDKNIASNVDSISTKQPSKKQQTLVGYSSKFPEKVWFGI